MPLRIIIAGFFLCIATACYSQDNKDSAFFAGMNFTPVGLSADSAGQKGSLPFSGVKVIDARFDTSITGYTQKTLLSGTSKVKFNTNCSNEIEQYITHNYPLTGTTGKNPSLVILLEKLWLSSSFETGRKEKGETPVIVQDAFGGKAQYTGPGAVVTNSVVMIKARLLAYADSNYYSIYQVDTAYLATKPLTGRNQADVIELGIDSMLTRLVNKQVGGIRISKRAIPALTIQEYVNARLNIPVVNAAAYTKGVFKTFEEFKNNQPSIAHFEVTRTDKSDALYVTEPGTTSYLLRDFWGYSDGYNIYINKGDNFFRLFKQNNTFVFYGFNTLSKIYRLNAGNTVLGVVLFGMSNYSYTTKFKGKKVPLQVDMETGDCF